MHEFRGGIRIGNSYFDAVNYSYPFARVCFAEKSLHFSIGIVSFRKNFSASSPEFVGEIRFREFAKLVI